MWSEFFQIDKPFFPPKGLYILNEFRMILLQFFGHDSIIIIVVVVLLLIFIIILIIFIIILIVAKPLNRLDWVLCHRDDKQPSNHDDERLKRHESKCRHVRLKRFPRQPKP